MVWSVKGEADSNELVIEASLEGWKSKFMSSSTMTKHRGNAARWGGKANGETYVRYAATMDVGGAIKEHRPDAFNWLEERQPWYAEPLYDDTKRGKSIVDGKARLILKDAATALLFKLTFG